MNSILEKLCGSCSGTVPSILKSALDNYTVSIAQPMHSTGSRHTRLADVLSEFRYDKYVCEERVAIYFLGKNDRERRAASSTATSTPFTLNDKSILGMLEVER